MRSLGVLLLIGTLSGCGTRTPAPDYPASVIHTRTPIAHVNALSVTPVVVSTSTDAGNAAPPPVQSVEVEDPARVAARGALPRVRDLHCSVPFEDASIILAKVGAHVLTACDVVLARRQQLREGRTPLSMSDTLQELVDDALKSDAAIARGLDRVATVRRSLRDTIAAGVVRSVARDIVRASEPSAERVSQYYQEHQTDFITAERVHLREIVLADQSRAEQTIRELLRGSTTFEALVAERTITREGQRDAGDIGLVPAAGNDHVSAAVATAGWSLTNAGDVYRTPVRVEQDITTMHHGHERHERKTTWHVVQYLGRVPQSEMPWVQAESIIRHRLGYRNFQSATEVAEEQILTEARRHVNPTIDVRAAGSVRVAAP